MGFVFRTGSDVERAMVHQKKKLRDAKLTGKMVGMRDIMAVSLTPIWPLHFLCSGGLRGDVKPHCMRRVGSHCKIITATCELLPR